MIVPGDNKQMVSLAVNSEGKSSFKEAVHDGNEVIVYKKYNEIKYRERVTRINNINKTSELSVLLPNYTGKIDPDLNPIYIDGIDIKSSSGYPTSDYRYYSFAKGHVNINSTIDSLTRNYFAIINDNLSEIIEDGDKVVYQKKIKGFEDIQSAISTNDVRGPLVVNGVIDPAIWDEAHPRTAFGIKENGDVFFIVVDGRDRLTPKHGVSLPELAHLMHSYGAVEAYNFDGGGSSTLMLKNGKENGSVLERFDVLNDLSDGRIRSLSNAFLVVKGDVLSKPVNIIGNEDRAKFELPTNLYIDNDMKLHFNKVEGATHYEVFINGLKIETTSNELQLKRLMNGENLIRVRAKGTSKYETSDEQSITYKINSSEIISLLNLIKKQRQ